MISDFTPWHTKICSFYFGMNSSNYFILLIFFQYQYNNAQASGIIQTLVRITVNTIDAQHHRCRRHDDTFGPASPVVPRNRGKGKFSLILCLDL